MGRAVLLGTCICVIPLASCAFWSNKADYGTERYEEGQLQSRDADGPGSISSTGESQADSGVLALRPEISGRVMGDISGIASGDPGSPTDRALLGEGAARWTLPPGAEPINLAHSFEPILFDYNSSRIDFPARRMLREVARWLGEHPSAHVTLEGHCDPKGSSEYNFNLGLSRASEAHQALKNLGVQQAHLHTISYGEERPRVLGNAPEADRLNRRVEFRLHSRPRLPSRTGPDGSSRTPPETQPTPEGPGIEVTADQAVEPPTGTAVESTSGDAR